MGENPCQGEPHFLQLFRGHSTFFLFLFQCLQLLFQVLDLPVEGIVAQFEFFVGKSAVNAHFQDPVLFPLNGSDFPFNPGGVPLIVPRMGDRLNHLNHLIHDSLFGEDQLVKNTCQDLVQLCGTDQGGRTTGSAAFVVDLALPGFLFVPGSPRCCPVVGGVVDLAEDFAAVGIAVMVIGSVLVGHALLAPKLVKGVGPVP